MTDLKGVLIMDFFNENVSGRTNGFWGAKATNWHVHVEPKRGFLGATTGYMVYADNSNGNSRYWKYDTLDQANDAAQELAIALENGEIL